MKWMRNLHLIIAGFYLVLHSVIPHHHSLRDHDCPQLAAEESGILKFFTMIFEVDLGQHHFESTLDNASFDAFLCAGRVDSPAVFSTNIQTILPLCGVDIPVPSFIDASSERGPPMCIIS